MFLHALDEAESTNDLARSMALAGAPHGTVVHATRQTKGRGRKQRAWWSPDRGALLMSVVLRPAGPLARVAALALEVGVAIAELLAGFGVVAGVKWPNDVYVGGAKIAGVLCELVEDERGRWSVVVGIGLNCNIPTEMFPLELQGIATSLLAEIGGVVDVPDVVGSLASLLLERFARFDRFGLDVDAVNAVSLMRDARVRGEDGREGTALDVASSGALRVTWDGDAAASEVLAGDIIKLAL